MEPEWGEESYSRRNRTVRQVLPLRFLAHQKPVDQRTAALLRGAGQEALKCFETPAILLLVLEVRLAEAWVRRVEDARPLPTCRGPRGEFADSVDDEELAQGVPAGHVGFFRVVKSGDDVSAVGV